MHQGGLDDYIDDMWDYFSENVASNMKKLQNVSCNEPTGQSRGPTMDNFAEELLNLIEEMDIHQVSFCIDGREILVCSYVHSYVYLRYTICVCI